MAKKIVPPKRQLTFRHLDDVLTEANSLLRNGYSQYGSWTLGQACGHLADWMRFPMDGFPKLPIAMRPVFFVMRYTVAPGMKKKIMSEGFKAGMPTAPETVPKADELSDEQGVAKLEEVIGRVKKYDGELKPSPLFGEMDRATWLKVNLLHAAHHLGYLEPVEQ